MGGKLIDKAGQVMMQNYRQQPVVLSRGEGAWLFDSDGKRYLDMTAGIATCCLGHAHPKLTGAIAEQAGRLLHTSNLYFIEQQIQAADAITQRSFGERVYFCNSGAEANEAALKLARRYQHVVAKAPERNLIVSTHDSFHGRSIATVAITGQEQYRVGFGPLLEPVEMVPFADLDAAAKVLRREEACCFIVEPIQAEGGIVVPPAGYLSGLRQLCDETGTLLIFDEVQTGVGRTGKWWGHEWDDVQPDVMTLAKALGGGVPVGAVVANARAAEGLRFFEGSAVPHASTFGGNPLACAAVVTVFETIEEEGLLDNCQQMAAHLAKRFDALVQKYPGVALERRGRGLLQGVALRQPAAPAYRQCRERGLLVSVAGGIVLRFVPALNVKAEELDEAVDIVDSVLGGLS